MAHTQEDTMNLITHIVFKPLLVGGLLTLLPLAAQGPRNEGGPRHEKGQAFNLPGLSEAQKTTLKTIAEKHKGALDATRKAEGEAQKAFQKAMQDPAVKDADLKALFEKSSQARLASILAHRSLMQESLGVLSAEQKAEFEKRKAQGPRHEGGPRPQGRPGCGGGPDSEGGRGPEGPFKP
jgi:Spy/CpxP family protein refolding chaperone